MLVAAREMDCQHIWNAHAASARKRLYDSACPSALGCSPRSKGPAMGYPPDEAAVVYIGQGVLPHPQGEPGNAFQTANGQMEQKGLEGSQMGTSITRPPSSTCCCANIT